MTEKFYRRAVWVVRIGIPVIAVAVFVSTLALQIVNCGGGHAVVCAGTNATLVCNVPQETMAEVRLTLAVHGTARYCHGSVSSKKDCCRVRWDDMAAVWSTMAVAAVLVTIQLSRCCSRMRQQEELLASYRSSNEILQL